jgi:MoxR-like ATPase
MMGGADHAATLVAASRRTMTTGTRRPWRDGDEGSPVAPSDGERFWNRLREAVAVSVVGGEDALHRLAIALLADGHALVEDVPGTGKTTLAHAFARALGLSFARVQGTPDLLPGDVTGSSVFEAGAFRFVPGPVFANVLLVDEINRATPRTQSALLEAMQERQVSVDGVSHRLPDPFLVLATQNPIELEGTFSLPEAQLDRFLVRVSIGYPDEEAELRIAALYRDGAVPIDEVPTMFAPADLVALRDAASRVRVADDVHRYIVGLVRASRQHPDLRLGASPRASVALYRASQAAALLAGRDFARPDDVAATAPAVLGHRLLLDVDRELRGATTDAVVAELLESVPVPVPEAT